PARHRADHVRARAGLAHRESADEFAAAELRQVLAPLRIAAVEVEIVDAEIRMRAVGQADGGGRSRHLLHRDHVSEITEARAAVALWNRHAEEPELAELLPHVGGKF